MHQGRFMIQLSISNFTDHHNPILGQYLFSPENAQVKILRNLRGVLWQTTAPTVGFGLFTY
jgi:hypothetical protein